MSETETAETVPARAPAFPISPKQPPRPGRPTKLTPEVEAKIVQAVANGSFFEPAAQAAGVSKEAMREWLIRGQSDEQLGRNTVFRRFVGALIRAQAQNETRMAAVLANGGEGKYPDWRAQAFVLERRHKERWAAPKTESGPPLTLIIGGPELAALVDALRVARATVIETTATTENEESEKKV